MGNVYKRLGATTVTADTNTALYTVPASTEAIISSINVCNTGSTARTFRIAIVDGDIGTVSSEDYLKYDVAIAANGTYSRDGGLCLSAADSILVRASHAEVVFSVFGIEKS